MVLGKSPWAILGHFRVFLLEYLDRAEARERMREAVESSLIQGYATAASKNETSQAQTPRPPMV